MLVGHYFLEIKQPQWVLSHPTNDKVQSQGGNTATDLPHTSGLTMHVLLVINKYVSSDDVYVSILYVQVGCHSQKNNV